MKPTSVSAVHTKLLGALGAAPPFLSNPNFFLSGVSDPVNLPVGGVAAVALFPQYNNNGSEGYDDVQVELIGANLSIPLGNPEVIGTIGAANVGFAQNIGLNSGNTTGSEVVTLRLTGTLGGTTDVYGHDVEFTVNIT